MNSIIEWIIDNKSVGKLIVMIMILYIIVGYMDIYM